MKKAARVHKKLDLIDNFIDKKDTANPPGMRIVPLIKYAGFNALELMMVLAVIAVGIGVAIHTMTGNSNKQNTNQMISDVSSLVNNVKNAYTSSTTGYTSLTTTAAIQAALVPTDLKISGTDTIKNQFQGGTVELASINEGEAFTITYTNVPKAVCNSAITAMGGSTFISIVINSQSVYDGVAAQPTIDATTIAEACSAQGNTSTIVFTSN